ncbi:MAG: glutamate racemase [Marinomonas sp.]
MKIGIMDSGAGGVTILNAIRHKIPALDLVYLADEQFAPYGEKTSEAIRSRIIKIGRFFESEKVDAIVVACNTATVVAIDCLRSHTVLPVIGVEPAVKPAFRISKKRHVAVLATSLTANSQRLGELIALWREDSQVWVMSSPTLAFAIDAWPQSKADVEKTVKKLCDDMKASAVDTLVLACTHYPLVKSLFVAELGACCDIIEPSEGVASQLVRRLEQAYPERLGEFCVSNGSAEIEIFSTKKIEDKARLSQWVEDAAAIVCQKTIELASCNVAV